MRAPLHITALTNVLAGCASPLVGCGLPLLLLGGCGLPSGPTFESHDLRLDEGPWATDPDTDAPVLCESDGILHVAFADDRTGVFGVYYQRSADGGATWLNTPLRVDSSSGGARFPAIDCGGQTVGLAWEDERAGVQGHAQPFAAVSLDGGASFLPDVQLTLDESGRFTSRYPHIKVRDNAIWVTWFNNMYGAYDIFSATSFDGGASFQPPAIVNSSLRGSAWSGWPSLALREDGSALIIWEDLRDGAVDLYAASSSDGLTWSEDLRIDGGDAPGNADSQNATVAIDGLDAVITWHDQRDGEGFGVYYNWSTDGGYTWLAEAIRADGANPGEFDSLEPQVVLSGGRAHLVWYDERLGNFDIYYRSIFNGALEDNEQTIDRSGGTPSALYPKLAMRGDTLAVVWEDLRNDIDFGYSDLYYTFSLDGGLSWSEADYNLLSWEPGYTVATQPEACLSEDGAIQVAWSDGRYGTLDVLFTSLALGESGYTPADFRAGANAL